ncbi:MAG: GTP cyclohydrolase FolE2 [Chloroflexota bacterium]
MMKDTQGRADEREVDLQRVGVKNVDLPFRIQEKSGGIQTVLARVQLSVDLPRHYKGTHMSRFIEILEKWKDHPSSSGQLEHILAATRKRLRADRAHIRVGFKYFLSKRAPVSRQASTMGYDCHFDAMLCKSVGYDLVVGVHVPITTVCPCSKEISVAGAHNQRAWLKVKLRTVPGQFLWLEDLITQLERFGSCEIYPLVKRPDEKYVTERGYANPKFVEDVLRDVVIWLREHPLVTWFEVECEADESIHLHNAFAYQQEPLPAALNVFSRDLNNDAAYDSENSALAVLATSRLRAGRNGANGAYKRASLPDVASRAPR